MDNDQLNNAIHEMLIAIYKVAVIIGESKASSLTSSANHLKLQMLLDDKGGCQINILNTQP